MTAITSTQEIPAGIIGNLGPSGVAAGVRPCIPTSELREGDALFASGFRRGGQSRIVREVRFVGGFAYIRTTEGWYRYDRVYANVLEF